jgi:hypothetical protein
VIAVGDSTSCATAREFANFQAEPEQTQASLSLGSNKILFGRGSMDLEP